MDQVLGLVFLAGYIVGVIALAAGITYAVIRIFPTERKREGSESQKPESRAKPDANGGGGEGQGRLFRRSKRRES